jgi:FkbM family methyltransferase
MNDYKISYAQNREDRIIEAFFPDVKNGFYVDVGANHPVAESVTKIFYEKGWKGINIEPNKELYDLLVYDRPRDTNLNIGVSNKNGMLEFTQYNGDGLSTFSESTQQDYENSSQDFYKNFAKVVDRYEVSVKTLKDIFIESKVEHIHFMKIDVEGFEHEVLEGNDWKKYRPEVICIEANHIQKDWRPILSKNKYNLAFFDGLNNYYVAEEQDQHIHFSYPERMLLSGLVVAQPVMRYIKEIETNAKLTAFRLKNISAEQLVSIKPHKRAPIRQTAFEKARKIDKAIDRRLTSGKRIHVTRKLDNQYKKTLKVIEVDQIRLLARSYRERTIRVSESHSGNKPIHTANHIYRFSRKAVKSTANKLTHRFTKAKA